MKTIIISEDKLNLLSESAKAELAMLENKSTSLQKQCKDLITSFQNNGIEHRTDIGSREFDGYRENTILRVSRWHKTAGEQWGNCSGTYYIVTSIGTKYVQLEAEHYCTNERDWSEYRTIDIESFLSFLIEWKIAEDCTEPADQDILLKKLSAKIAGLFQ